MKQQLLVLLISLKIGLLSYAQQPSDTITIPDLKSGNCFKEISKIKETDITNNIGLQEANNYQLVLVFAKPAQARNVDKILRLKNLTAEKVLTGKMENGNLVFNFENPLSGVESAIFQLANADNKICYQVVIKFKKQDETETKTLKPLILTSYTLNVDPCVSCSPDGNKIIYDFSKNSLKNLKTKNNSNRFFSIEYLRKRWTKLPHVGEEMVFEVQNVNPFKFDITLSDEVVIFNTEAPSFLTSAFTPKDGASMVGEDKKAIQDKKILEAALQNLNEAIEKKIEELRNAGDCLNPCSYIKPAVQEIHQYFTQLGYNDNTVSLEAFLTKKIKELFTEASEAEKVKELTGIVAKFYAFRNAATGTFSYRIPQIKNVDQYLFKLNITPKPNILTGARVLNQEIAVDILWGFKVDVTTGLFFTSLLDESYIIHPDSTVIKTVSGFADSIVYNRRNKVIQETKGKQDFGVASFFHFYPKITPNINLAFSLGAGVTLNQKPKLRYLGGISLLLGKTNRLAISYGWALGFVDQLSDRYINQRDANGNLYTSPSESKVELKKKFDAKSFISLTYSIPLFKKKEEVKPAAATEAEKTESDNKGEEDKKEEK